MNATLTAYIQFHPLWPFIETPDRPTPTEVLHNITDYIKKNGLRIDDTIVLKSSMALVPWEEVPSEAKVHTPKIWPSHSFWRITAHADSNITQFSADGELTSPDDYEQLWISTITDMFSHGIESLFIAANLAYPGLISLLGGTIIKDGAWVGTVQSASSTLDNAVSEAKENGWPCIRDLPLDCIIPWLESLPNYFHGVSSMPIERAVNAFFHFFDRDLPSMDEYLCLMWAMIGLESLYVEGRTDIQNQVLKKSQLLLGHNSANKKALARLYDMRSRFVHGAADFKRTYVVYYDTDQISASDHAFDSATALAQAMLVATLQVMAVDGRKEIEFDYAIKPKK